MAVAILSCNVTEDFVVADLAEARAGTFEIRVSDLVGVRNDLLFGIFQLGGGPGGGNFFLLVKKI